MGRLIVVAGFVLFLSSSTLADVIRLKDGSVLEGEVLEQSTTSVRVKTRFGTVDLARTRIDRIEKKASPVEEYQRQLAGLEPGDVEGLYQLALFCQGKGLRSQQHEVLEKVLSVDPQHEGAHLGLGHIRYQGEWFDQKSLKDHQRREAREKKAQGLVLDNGVWMPEAEAMAARGMVLHEGDWVPEKDLHLAGITRDFPEAMGVPVLTRSSPHFLLHRVEEEDGEGVLRIWEKACQELIDAAELDKAVQAKLSRTPIDVFVLTRPSQVTTFIDSGFVDRYRPDRSALPHYRSSSNFTLVRPKPLIVISLDPSHRSTHERRVNLNGWVLTNMAQILLGKVRGQDGLPGWVEAGYAHYLEEKFNEGRTLTLLQYPDQGEAAPWVEGWESYSQWETQLADSAVRHELPGIDALMGLRVSELTAPDLAKSWSLVRFLIERHPRKFFQFVLGAGIADESGDIASFEETFLEVFGIDSLKEIQTDWHLRQNQSRPSRRR